jgi:hypothetical protein
VLFRESAIGWDSKALLAIVKYEAAYRLSASRAPIAPFLLDSEKSIRFGFQREKLTVVRSVSNKSTTLG